MKKRFQSIRIRITTKDGALVPDALIREAYLSSLSAFGTTDRIAKAEWKTIDPVRDRYIGVDFILSTEAGIEWSSIANYFAGFMAARGLTAIIVGVDFFPR